MPRDDKITPERLLAAYAQGYFPMAESRDSPEIFWFYPERRGILPLEAFHIPRSLKKFLKTCPYEVTVNQAFGEVIRACAGTRTLTRSGRVERGVSAKARRAKGEARGEISTWINGEIIALYTELHRMGHAHSVECWEKDGRAQRVSEASERNKKLVGGLYGVSLGGAFFGESMFSRQENASKVALAHLVERLRNAGYTLLDTQYVNPHLTQFGCIEIPRKDYLALLKNALIASPNPSMRFLTGSPARS